jgi:hypothetical protein|tara:strand:- start:33 stop:302 length:270 start_codon:yes stop_codon:yes gene_type:complete
MIVRLTLAQMLRATKAVKSLPKKKVTTASLGFKMPKKTGWKKPFFPKSKMFPEYSPYDVAIDLGSAGVFVGGVAGYKKLTKNKKKTRKK